jgi:hypothetical protein
MPVVKTEEGTIAPVPEEPREPVLPEFVNTMEGLKR